MYSHDPVEEAIPEKMTIYYLGLLMRGPQWTPDETDEVLALQEAHMENIRRMGKLGKLVIAGPFLDDGRIRGIYVFKTTSLEEAQALTEGDPAVQAGRLTFELHPWLAPAVVLP